MSFLDFSPSVFVIGEEYELLFHLKEYGLFSLRIGDAVYYEENFGTLPSERRIVRIRVPQAVLDTAREYTAVYRRTTERRAYFSLFEDEVCETFTFRPLPSEGDLHIYFIADVHYRFASAEKTAAYFGDELDLLIAAGDLGEVETEENYLEVCEFLANITGGRVPILFVRGNHDTRGRLAERFTDYFPAEGKNTYYAFSLPRFAGVVLDCGEDKPDDYLHTDATHENAPVYNGTAAYEAFRRRETSFLRSLSLPTDRPLIAISHIPPVMTTQKPGDIFDIERPLYTEWSAELSRLGIDVMLAGHLHRTFLLPKGDERSTAPHDFPVIVGAAILSSQNIIGTAILLNERGMTYRFTDEEHRVLEEGYLPFTK